MPSNEPTAKKFWLALPKISFKTKDMLPFKIIKTLNAIIFFFDTKC